MLKECTHLGNRIKYTLVLILILMEHAQRAKEFGSYSLHCQRVLILILMEHAQRAMEKMEVTSKVIKS